MRSNPNFKQLARWLSAAAMLALLGCTSTGYERSTGEYFDDKALIGRVKHALNAQPVYKYPDVKVNSYRGVVQLSGFVASDAQRDAATEIAERVRGVQQIENNILIAPLERTAVREYIPGREGELNDTNRVYNPAGRAPLGSGSETNRVR